MKSKKKTVVVESANPQFDYIQPIEAKPLEVKVYGGNCDRAIKVFRSLVQKERILSIYKEKQSFEKPSDKKRRKRNESMRKNMELENSFYDKPTKKEKEKEKEARNLNKEREASE